MKNQLSMKIGAAPGGGRQLCPSIWAAFGFLVLLFAQAVSPHQVLGADAGIAISKITLVDPGTSGGKAKLKLKAKSVGIEKGPDGALDDLDVTVDVYYTDGLGAGAGRFVIPPDPALWTKNDGEAKYSNKETSAANSTKKLGLKPGKSLSIAADALGDGASVLDLVVGGEPSAAAGISVMVSLFNRVDGSLHRMCSRFATDLGSEVKFKEKSGGTARSLRAKDGVAENCPLDYGDDANWLCRPGMATNQCLVNSLDATVLAADNSTSVEPHVPASEPDYDCFYVYPTVHLVGPISNFIDRSDVSLELDMLLSQAARLTRSCRVFAPIYRQITLPTFTAPDFEKFLEFAYRDVEAAFDEYMTNHNGGRDIVLLGHSQGTRMVTRLMVERFDADPALREQLIVGLPIGGGVVVPVGQTVGGTFVNIPTCTSDVETGCVIAFRSYAAGFPPEGGSNDLGLPGMDQACTNPGSLAGGKAPIRSYFPDMFNQPIFTYYSNPVVGGEAFTRVDDFYSAECVVDETGNSYLEIGLQGDPGEMRADGVNYGHIALAPSFLGTHLLDYNFVMQDLIELVEIKAAAMPD